MSLKYKTKAEQLAYFGLPHVVGDVIPISTATGIDAQWFGVETPKSRVFESGAKRDTNKGKIRPDLISPYMLKALGKVLATGADHYGDRNWEKGMPQECFKESASRHYVQWMNNETDEDHAAQLIFNVMAWIHFRDKPNE